MDLNSYAVEKLAEARLSELRAQRARRARLAAANVLPRGIAPRLGVALVRLGRWLAGGDATVATNVGCG
jgi:hypothetical protein